MRNIKTKSSLFTVCSSEKEFCFASTKGGKPILQKHLKKYLEKGEVWQDIQDCYSKHLYNFKKSTNIKLTKKKKSTKLS